MSAVKRVKGKIKHIKRNENENYFDFLKRIADEYNVDLKEKNEISHIEEILFYNSKAKFMKLGKTEKYIFYRLEEETIDIVETTLKDEGNEVFSYDCTYYIAESSLEEKIIRCSDFSQLIK